MVTALIVATQAYERTRIQVEVEKALQDLPFNRFPIELPQFAERVWDIRDFGAVGDGLTLCTDAINRAIAQCSANGGGKVLIPPGLWLTGPIVMHSNVNLHLAAGALVTFSREREHYPVIKVPRRGFEAHPLIYGVGLTNVAVTGEGILNGSGEVWRPVKRFKQTARQWEDLLNSGGVVDRKGEMWWPSPAALAGEEYLRRIRAAKAPKEITPEDLQPARDYLRPNMVLFINCRRVLLDGITVANSPRFALYPNWCQDIVIRNVKINNEWWAQNGDGIDFSSCQRALVYGCTVTAGDDAICLKAGDAPQAEQPVVRDIVIRNCVVYHGHGGFVIGSNTSGGVRNVLVTNCSFVGTDLGIRFKSARDRGGRVENIFIKNIFMKDISGAALYVSTYYQEFTQEPYDTLALQPITKTTPIFNQIFLDSIYSIDSREIATMIGLPEMPLSNIAVSNSSFTAQKGVEITNARGLQFKNVGFYSKAAPVIRLQQVSDTRFEAIKFKPDLMPLMKIAGAQSTKIQISQTTATAQAGAVVLSPEVQATAVRIEP